MFHLMRSMVFSKRVNTCFLLLAHLSRRLTRWAYSIPIVRHPSVIVVHTFKLEYLWGQWTNLDQIYVASLGWGKGCISIWDRSDQNSGFHGNRKCPLLTYNGENDVSKLMPSVLIWSSSNQDRHNISDEFEFWWYWITDFEVTCSWASKKFP